MKKIQVLGTGCPKCKTLTENARKAKEILGGDFEVEKIEDINKIIEMGVISTPGVALNGKVLSAGKLINPDEIVKLIRDNCCDCNGKECS